MQTTVIEPSPEPLQFDRGERLADAGVSLAWIRRHFGEISYKRAKQIRAQAREKGIFGGR